MDTSATAPVTITRSDYEHDKDKRAIADALSVWAKVDLRDIAYIEQTDGGWRLKVWKSRFGKRYVRRGQVAHRWITLKNPTP